MHEKFTRLEAMDKKTTLLEIYSSEVVKNSSNLYLAQGLCPVIAIELETFFDGKFFCGVSLNNTTKNIAMIDILHLEISQFMKSMDLSVVSHSSLGSFVVTNIDDCINKYDLIDLKNTSIDWLKNELIKIGCNFLFTNTTKKMLAKKLIMCSLIYLNKDQASELKTVITNLSADDQPCRYLKIMTGAYVLWGAFTRYSETEGVYKEIMDAIDIALEVNNSTYEKDQQIDYIDKTDLNLNFNNL